VQYSRLLRMQAKAAKMRGVLKLEFDQRLNTAGRTFPLI